MSGNLGLVASVEAFDENPDNARDEHWQTHAVGSRGEKVEQTVRGVVAEEKPVVPRRLGSGPASGNSSPRTR